MRGLILLPGKEKKMRVESADDWAKLEKVRAFLDAAQSEVKEKGETFATGSRRYYEAFGMRYGLCLAKSILELTGQLSDKNMAALVERLLDTFLD